MRVLKTILIVVGCIIAAVVIISAIYLLVHRQGVIETTEIGSAEAEKSILIASQGSEFKNALVESLANHYREKAVYVKITDVTTMADINEAEWDAVVIICTFEKWKLQKDAKKYLDRAKERDKIILIVTSGSGDQKGEGYGIDVITSASRESDLGSMLPIIGKKLDQILSTEENE